MKNRTLKSKFKTITSIVTIALLILVFAPDWKDVRNSAQAPLASYIVQANSLQKALWAATDVGGNITHELGIIKAVGADLTVSQVEILRRMEGVKVLENRRVLVSSILNAVRDEFNAEVYRGNDGTQSWSGPWVESDDGKIKKGKIKLKDEKDESKCLAGYCLNLDSNGGLDRYIYREVNLDGAQSAFLSYYVYHELEGADQVVAEISPDGGTSYVVLKVYDESTHKQATAEIIDVSPYIGPQTRLRFRIAADDEGKKLWLDDVEIKFGAADPGNNPPEPTESPQLAAELATIRDEFNTLLYSGEDGTLDWSGPWVESDDGDVDNGKIRVKDDAQCLAGYCLKLESNGGLDKYIYREANFDGAQGALLSYYFYHELEKTDQITVEISDDSGVTYDVLKVYDQSTFKKAAIEIIDVTPYIGPQTRLRFRITGAEAGKKMWLDDVQFLFYVGSTYGDELPVNETDTISDEFNTLQYSGNDGTLGWSGPWVESDDGTFDGGKIKLKDESECMAGYCLKLDSNDGLDKYIYREANLNGAESALLSYHFYHELEKADQIVAEISRDGGVTYDILKVYDQSTFKKPAIEIIDVTPYIGPQTRLRFRITGEEAGKKMWLDDVQLLFNIYMLEALHTEFVDATVVHAEGTEGSGVTVAVVDTGYWPHPALDYNSNGQGRVLAQYDAIEDHVDAVGLPTVDTDDNGHGTYVTSILLSSEVSGSGSSQGLAPMADLVSVKAFDAEGTSNYLDVIRGIDFVVNNKLTYGIQVLNLSFSSVAQSLYWQDPLAQAVMAAWNAGIVVVTSAGNAGPDPMTIGVPGNVPYVITSAQ